MTTANMANYKKEVIEATQQIVQSGIMTKSLHGNVSLKLPDQDAFLLTAGGSLASMAPENIALFRLDGYRIMADRHREARPPSRERFGSPSLLDSHRLPPPREPGRLPSHGRRG